MLSNCQNCKYFHPELCAVNPDYRVMENKLRSQLSAAEIAACDVGILACQDWEPSAELEPISLELTLTRREWQQMLRSSAVLPQPLIAQLQTVVGVAGEILMLPVVSSNIAAIGYDFQEQVLQVDFLTGSRYRYLGVPQWVFDEFQLADSKGRYLNREIKGCFSYERAR